MTNSCLSLDNITRETFTDYQVKEIFEAVTKAVEEEISKQYFEICSEYQKKDVEQELVVKK